MVVSPAASAATRTLVKSTCAVMSRSPASSSHAPGRLPDPLDGAQIDFDAPARLERDSKPIEVRGQLRCRGRTFARSQGTARRLDIDFAQPVAPHDDLMDGQRVEQLVGEQ